jgi:hypothetical protein
VNYVDQLAHEIREQVPPALQPEGEAQLLFRLYALLARIKGERVSAEDVHDAWCIWMSTEDPSHPSIRPFEELDDQTRQEDEPFVDAIRQAVRSRHSAT